MSSLYYVYHMYIKSRKPGNHAIASGDPRYPEFLDWWKTQDDRQTGLRFRSEEESLGSLGPGPGPRVTGFHCGECTTETEKHYLS